MANVSLKLGSLERVDRAAIDDDDDAHGLLREEARWRAAEVEGERGGCEIVLETVGGFRELEEAAVGDAEMQRVGMVLLWAGASIWATAEKGRLAARSSSLAMALARYFLRRASPTVWSCARLGSSSGQTWMRLIGRWLNPVQEMLICLIMQLQSKGNSTPGCKEQMGPL
uniref:Uncharacterized protein n=1 Tax=Dunaliella tertiolecta TaxID=3047 RepID=A0A7S3R280_DUNTE